MLQTLIKKLSICFVSIFIIVTCASCKADTAYYVEDYLNDLAIKSGLSDEKNIDKNIVALKNWKLIEDETIELNDRLKYELLCNSLGRLLECEDDYIEYFKKEGLIDNKKKKDSVVDIDDARKLIDEVVYRINNKTIDRNYSYRYKESVKDNNEDLKIGDIILEDNIYKVITDISEDGYICDDASFEEVFSDFEISDSFEIDFNEAEIIPYFKDENIYVNENYNLIASNNHVFNTNGFRVSYNVSGSGLNVHVSRNAGGLNIYGDLSIHNVKPTIKWAYKENDLKNCFFKVGFNTTEKLGVSDGKYGNYYLDFKDLDSSSFTSLLKSMVNPMSDKVEASIPICQIKTPIPNIPTAKITLDVLIKIYVSGKIELAFYNNHQVGFETKGGSIRYINDHTNNFDSIIKASGKSALGLNLGLEAARMKLADVELDSGIKAEVSSTMHLYDEEGNVSAQKSDVSYGALEEISKENENVKVCGDVSLYWLMDLTINTSQSKMAKLGFSRTFHIMDDDNQIFGNLHHIENGHFVEKCSRKSKTKIKTMESVVSNKIVLDSYAEVINPNETYQIIIKSLPENYYENQITYNSPDNNIATVSSTGLIKAISPGSVQIAVSSNDQKYKAYVNILVSTG